MSTDTLFSHLVHGPDGAWSTAYGSFVIRTALQPVFRRLPDGTLDLDSFQGLARPERDGDAFTPSEFFPQVDPADRPDLDSLLRTIHILNTGVLRRSRARIFVAFDPHAYAGEKALRHEIERLRLSAHEAGLTPDRIICELSARNDGSAFDVQDCAARLRATGFRIAMCDYGAGEMDAEHAATLRPDYVKFDADWVRDYMTNPPGFALLKVIVRQFNADGIQAVFERLEDMWQVDLCAQLGVPLMQGYALARPQTVPTSFNATFPEMLLSPDQMMQTVSLAPAPVSERRHPRLPIFGKRQA